MFYVADLRKLPTIKRLTQIAIPYNSTIYRLTILSYI